MVEMQSGDAVDNQSKAASHQYYIGALAKGLDVLGLFGADKPEITLKDIGLAAGVTQPSALRIAHTLVECGYMVRNPRTKGYRLGPKIVSIAFSTLNAMTLPEICQPYMAALRDRTDETIKLGIPMGQDVVIISREPSRRYPPGHQYVGSHAPLYLGSLGRAMLAQMTDGAIAAALDTPAFQQPTPKSLSRKAVEAELKATRERGYSLNDQGVTTENRSVGAALISPGGFIVGSINLSVSAQRISLEALQATYAPLVMETAAQISVVLPAEVQGGGRVERR